MYNFSWIFVVLSLAGKYLNIRKNKYCFLIWAFTNLFWLVFDFINGVYSRSLLYSAYFILAVYGLWKWKKDESK